MLISGFAIPLSFWNHNNFDNALVALFFKLKSAEKKTPGKVYNHQQNVKPQYTEFVPTKFCNLCEYISECLPCKCCKRDRKYLGM